MALGGEQRLVKATLITLRTTLYSPAHFSFPSHSSGSILFAVLSTAQPQGLEHDLTQSWHSVKCLLNESRGRFHGQFDGQGRAFGTEKLALSEEE